MPRLSLASRCSSGLRTDEHQATQDGRLRHALAVTGEQVDIRVSIVPTYYGENVVMRLLTASAGGFTLEDFGFSAADRNKIELAVRRPSGMILSTGPTGSGKTTTLYTLLRQLNTKEVSIVTIEDPIEYAIAGVKQIQVNARTGLTFATGLRSILRQDPNIIMVGEIRDPETAGIAVNTALTGHLLLSTLHTNDAATTLPRLLDMGIDAYLVASTIALAIGQRLVRRICPACREARAVSQPQADALAYFPLREKDKGGRSILCRAAAARAVPAADIRAGCASTRCLRPTMTSALPSCAALPRPELKAIAGQERHDHDARRRIQKGPRGGHHARGG